MPIPVPTANEAQDAFIGRCMSDDKVRSEFPDENQRAGVCMTAWESAQKRGGDLTAPIMWKDEARRIVYGPVLVPDIEDSDGDVVTADKIEKVAHKFLEDYGLMEHMHTLRAVARPVESYIAPVDLEFGDTRVPKGSWVVGAHITDDGAWEEVAKGRLTGFSIVAVPTGATKSTAEKKLTLREIEKSGRDWEVVAIGLVDMPAVPLAKWTAIKRAEDTGVLERLKSIFASKDLIVFSEGNQKQEETHERSVEVDEKELKELIATTIGEAVTPLADRLTALEGAGEKNKEEEESKKSEETEAISKSDLEAALEAASKAGAQEAVTEVLTKFEEYLESQPKASAKSLAESLRGQDGHAEKSAVKPTRDPWGRRIKEGVKS